MKSTPAFLIVLLLSVLASCAPRITGYAVVLWPEVDSALSAGEILPILETSRLQETITVQVGDDRIVLPTSRVSIFDAEPAARAFLESFSEWTDTYARSLITALPVRASADRTSTRLYRLRDGEVIKVINRTDEPSDEAGLIDYWYQVITENGVVGWVFGRSLELVSAGGRPLTPRDDKDRLDRLVRDIATATWRPEYFSEMTRTGRINLERFSPRFGMFGDPDEGTFRIVMPTYRIDFNFDDYTETGLNRVRFNGTNLTLELPREERLIATFLFNDRQRTENFVLFTDDIEEIILAERARRQQLLEQFISRGNGLISTAFGSMEIGERGALVWTGYERLVPDILPQRFDGTATLEFSLFIADALRNRYDGGLRIVMGPGMWTSFLYTITDDGVRLVYIPGDLVSENNIVGTEPSSPVVLFFRYFQN